MQLSQTELALKKAEARRRFSAERAELSRQYGERLSADICTYLLDIISTSNAKTVLMYSPIRSEVNILPLAKKLLELGVCIAFPISCTEDTTLDFRYISSFDDLSEGAYGILEPSENCKKVLSFDGCICIVPALAADRSGHRLGYGNGYYDRFLQNNSMTTVCPIFSDLVISSLPCEKTDFPIDIICTEKEVIVTCHENQLFIRKR